MEKMRPRRTDCTFIGYRPTGREVDHMVQRVIRENDPARLDRVGPPRRDGKNWIVTVDYSVVVGEGADG